MDYKDFSGNGQEIISLKNAIRLDSISHSYLFEGQRGLDLGSLALGFAKTLLCQEGGQEPCNICDSCIKCDTLNHPDLFLLEATNGLIPREAIDKLIDKVHIKPFSGNRKIFIISGANYLTLDSQNILLKTLEEPPVYLHILMTAEDKSKILPTILSRCQIIKFYPKNTFDYLIKSESYIENRDKIISIVGKLLEGDKTKAFSSMDFFKANKDNIGDILDIFLVWFRDLMIYKETGNQDLLVNQDRLDDLMDQLFVDLNKISGIMYKIESTKINIKANVNFELSLETMLLSM